MKSSVHAGAKSQLGGVKEGLLISLYQVLTEDDVNRLPINPTSSGIATDINNFKPFGISTSLPY